MITYVPFKMCQIDIWIHVFRYLTFLMCANKIIYIYICQIRESNKKGNVISVCQNLGRSVNELLMRFDYFLLFDLYHLTIITDLTGDLPYYGKSLVRSVLYLHFIYFFLTEICLQIYIKRLDNGRSVFFSWSNEALLVMKSFPMLCSNI